MDRRTPPRLLDYKLPLPWLLASAFGIVFTTGVLINKVDNIGTSVTKLETKIDAKDEKLNMALTFVTEVKAENKIQQAQIDRNVSELLDVKRNIQEIQLSRIKSK